MISTFNDILTDFVETKKWFNSINIETKETRLEQISKKLHELNEVDVNASNSGKITHNKFGNEGQEALAEAFSFNNIRKGLETINNDSLPKNKLKEIIKGPFYSTDEVSGDANVNPRNLMFELELASIMILKGFPLLNFEDIEVEFGKYTVAVQCKRLFSERNIPENTYKAYQQLKSKNELNQHKDKRGIIALSVEKIKKLDEKILLAKDYNTCIKRLHFEIRDFYSKNLKLFDRYYGLKNFWGILFYMKYDAYIIDISTISMIEGLHLQCFLNPRDSNSQLEFKECQSFLEKIINE